MNGELDLWRWLFKNQNVRNVVDVGVKYTCTLIDALTQSEQDVCRFDLVEAFPDFCKIIRDKYQKYSNVHIHAVAADEKSSGVVSYHPTSESVVLRSVTKPASYDRIPPIKVPCRRLDELITHIVDFIKIDVEGHELSVLKGASKLLNNVQFVQFEYGGTYLDANITIRSVVDVLASKGLVFIYAIEAGGLNFTNEPPEDFRYKNYLVSRNKLRMQ